MSTFNEFMAEAIHKELHDYTNDKIPRDLWGYQLILSLEGCPDNIIMDLHSVKEFVLNTVDLLKMQPIGEPISRFFKDNNGVGCSVIQLLSESHVSCHTSGHPDNNAAFIDVFSCDYYDPEKILPYIKTVFSPNKMSYIFVLRNPGTVKVLKNV